MHLLEVSMSEMIRGYAMDLVAVIVPIFLSWLAVRLKWSMDAKEAAQGIATGVMYAQQRYVDKKKELSADGDFSEADQAEARKYALEGALASVRPSIAKVIKAWGEKKTEVMIEAHVAASKAP